jgi:hypothetical protein
MTYNPCIALTPNNKYLCVLITFFIAAPPPHEHHNRKIERHNHKMYL